MMFISNKIIFCLFHLKHMRHCQKNPILSPKQVILQNPLQSFRLESLHTSAIVPAIAGNISGNRFLEITVELCRRILFNVILSVVTLLAVTILAMTLQRDTENKL